MKKCKLYFLKIFGHTTDETNRHTPHQSLCILVFSRFSLGHDLLVSLAGFDRLAAAQGPQIDPQWLELQRRYASLGHPGGPPHGAHIPGVYPPASLASDLMRQERERIERLGE